MSTPKVSVSHLSIAGPLLVTPKRFEDPRGYFVETFNATEFAAVGVVARFVQDNQSLSRQRGTVRGLHFQSPPTPQAKLVRVLRGSIFDVAVDLRKDSPTYGKWCSATLTDEHGEQMFVPRGFAHGFCTLEDNTVVAYKTDNLYDPSTDNGIFWNDPDVGIAWPIAEADATLSVRDQKLRRLSDIVSPFVV